jgi:hypothetical protein
VSTGFETAAEAKAHEGKARLERMRTADPVGFEKHAMDTVRAHVDAYFKAWNYEPGKSGKRFDPAPAMKLYTEKPSIEDLMPSLVAMKHGDFHKTHYFDAAEYSQSMDVLYNSAKSFKLRMDPGSLKLERIGKHHIAADVDFHSVVDLKFPPITRNIVGHGRILFEEQPDGRWLISNETLKKKN